MTTFRALVFFWLFITSAQLLQAQVNRDQSSLFNFKDGLYLSLEEFKANNPSIPLNKDKLGNIGSGNVIRMKRIEYGPDEKNLSIPSSHVLFVCINGTAFINHRSMRTKNKHYSVSYFYKLHLVGYFCNYFLQTDRSLYKAIDKVETFTHVFVPGMNVNVFETSRGPQVPEYVLYLGNDRIYNVRKSSKELKRFVKRDNHFASTRIKNKELIIYLGLYNKRNLFEFGG